MSFNLIPLEQEDMPNGLPSLNMINNTLLLIETIKYLPNHSFTCLDRQEEGAHSQEENNSIEEQIQQETVHDLLTPSIKRKKTGCTCSKTNCLKRYCECFSTGKMCTPECACYGCHNNHEHEHLINKTKSETKCKGPRKVSKGCICKKSQCQKKYCECFNAGVACTDACKCIDCENHLPSSSCCSSSGERKSEKYVDHANEDSEIKNEPSLCYLDSLSCLDA